MTITNIEYNQFIGIYDTEYDTDDLIEYWRYQDKCGATFKRVGTWGASGKKAQGVHARKDSCLATSDFMMDHACGYVYMQFYNNVIGECLEEYAKEYEHLRHYSYQQAYLNVQRTLPREGYHAWHTENGNLASNRRIMATMMYLKDVEEGGETEFLYQSLRFQPKRGQVLIWPAGFTHVHRGNPPLKGEKFIATSWLENINM